MRIVDYLNGAHISSLWNRLELWARSIGFEVYRDHGAVQIGLSCGVVAGHVLTTPRQADDFMTAVTTGVVDASVLRSANRVLCENVAIHTGNPFIPLHWCLPDPITGLAPARSGVTKNLGEGACTAVADHFNGERPSTVHSGGYISWVSLDQAIYKIAQAVGHASNSASPHHAEGFGLFYFGTNDAYSTEQGHHWIAIFIEVLPFDNQEGVRARGAVQAPRQHPRRTAARYHRKYRLESAALARRRHRFICWWWSCF